jgi:Rod binding domain-containing protein
LAINPPGDIVLGVANAADPLKRQAAAERLARMSGTGIGQGAERAATSMAPADVSPPLAAPGQARSGSTSPADRPRSQSRGKAEALSQFEAFVLQTFIQSMLPSHAATVFGRGTAGEVWKSMLAESLARELAQSGQVGIARQMAAGASPAPNNRAGPELATPPMVLGRPTASLDRFLPYAEIRPANVDDGRAAGSIGSPPPTGRS